MIKNIQNLEALNYIDLAVAVAGCENLMALYDKHSSLFNPEFAMELRAFRKEAVRRIEVKAEELATAMAEELSRQAKQM
jgi:hypothetical protein